MAVLRRTPTPEATQVSDDPGEAVLAFVEELAVSLEAEGLPRMAGRIFAILLVSQPSEQTAAHLRQVLRASAGSISAMTRLLVGAGLIERVSRAGHRGDRFRVTPEGLSSLVGAGTFRLSRYRRLTARGLEVLADRTPAERARLQELHDLYAFFEARLPALVEEWQRIRSEVHP